MRIIIGLVIAILAWAVYLIGDLGAGPTPDPIQPSTPTDPYTPICPTTATHAAIWLQRGAPCPAVATAGSEGT